MDITEINCAGAIKFFLEASKKVERLVFAMIRYLALILSRIVLGLMIPVSKRSSIVLTTVGSSLPEAVE